MIFLTNRCSRPSAPLQGVSGDGGQGAEAGESLIRDVRVQLSALPTPQHTPECTVTAVGKQCITRRALIPDNLTWEIYDKPSKPHKTTEEGGTTPTPGGGEDEG